MSKAEIIKICDIVKDEMYTKGCRKMDLSIEEKVLISIKTLALGSFQNCLKDFIKISNRRSVMLCKLSPTVYQKKQAVRLHAKKSR